MFSRPWRLGGRGVIAVMLVSVVFGRASYGEPPQRNEKQALDPFWERIASPSGKRPH